MRLLFLACPIFVFGFGIACAGASLSGLYRFDSKFDTVEIELRDSAFRYNSWSYADSEQFEDCKRIGKPLRDRYGGALTKIHVVEAFGRWRLDADTLKMLVERRRLVGGGFPRCLDVTLDAIKLGRSPLVALDSASSYKMPIANVSDSGFAEVIRMPGLATKFRVFLRK